MPYVFTERIHNKLEIQRILNKTDNTPYGFADEETKKLTDDAL
jgi:hypothetical protein